MKNSKLTKLVALASVLLVSVATLAGSTVAWFTDTEEVVNTIQSGDLDIELEFAKVASGTVGAWNQAPMQWDELDPSTTMFNENALYEPGYTEVALLKVRNAGNLALQYKLSVDANNTVLGESVQQNANPGTGDPIFLSDHLKLAAFPVESEDAFNEILNVADKRAAVRSMIGDSTTDGADGDHIPYISNGFENVARPAKDYATELTEDGADIDPIVIQSFAEDEGFVGSPIENIELWPKNVAEPGSDEDMYALVLYMPEEVGNEANNRKVEDGKIINPTIQLGIKLEAAQVVEESDSFGDDYDVDATYADSGSSADDDYEDEWSEPLSEDFEYVYVAEPYTDVDSGLEYPGYYKIMKYTSDWLGWEDNYYDPIRFQSVIQVGENPIARVRAVGAGAFVGENVTDKIYLKLRNCPVDMIDDGAFKTDVPVYLQVDQDRDYTFGENLFANRIDGEPQITFCLNAMVAWEDSALKNYLDSRNLIAGTDYYLDTLPSAFGMSGITAQKEVTVNAGEAHEATGYAALSGTSSYGSFSFGGVYTTVEDDHKTVYCAPIVQIGGAERTSYNPETGENTNEGYPSFGPGAVEVRLDKANYVIKDQAFAAGTTVKLDLETTFYGSNSTAFTGDVTGSEPVVSFYIQSEEIYNEETDEFIIKEVTTEELENSSFFNSLKSVFGNDFGNGAVKIYTDVFDWVEDEYVFVGTQLYPPVAADGE